MTHSSFRARVSLWVVTPIELDVFCNQLADQLRLPSFNFDAENVYEWGLTKIEQGWVEINISRKHNPGDPDFEEPFHILFLVENTAPAKYDNSWVVDNLVRIYGQAIANLTSKPAYYGDIKYVGSEAYTYRPATTFTPDMN